jgi:pimeloyl-ACP methyl ester carboxylesterase
MPESEELLVQLGDTFATLFVRIWRANKSRGTVFCVHGFDGNGSDFDFLAARLREDGFNVVCPDMIGRGRSTYLGDASRYEFGVFVNCLAAVSKFAGTRNHFIGTSWGGVVVMALLAGAPIKADKLVLNDVSLRGSSAVDDLANRLRQESLLTFERIDEAYAYVRRTRAFLGDLSESSWTSYVRNRIREDNGRYRLAYDPFAVPAARQERYDRVAMFDSINADVLLMYGAQSPFLDHQAIASIRERNPRVSFAAVQGAGHPLSLMTSFQSEMISSFFA